MKERLIALMLLLTLGFNTLVSCDGFFNRTDEQGNDNEQNNNQSGTDNNGNNGASDDKDFEISDELAYELSNIDVPERFKSIYKIDQKKLEDAAAKATAKLKAFSMEHGAAFTKTSSENYKYEESANNNWTCGMYTGCYLMAYQLTGDLWFRNIVVSHISSFVEREKNRVGMDDHDVGFAFVPSCVGAYKVLGMENARDAALRAVEYYYNTGYSKEGKFIIRAHAWSDKMSGYRTMIDSLMNASLFFWAGTHEGNSDYLSAGYNHNLTSVDLIVRDDGSTYHHYQFDPETSEPLYGLTWQGLSDDSCWSRGHSWGVYGFSIAYSYVRDETIKNAQRDVTYYMLNHLPEDLIPYWDYTFMDGEEPRDSSAAAIAICGMLDMASMLPENSAQRIVYESAAAQMMEALIDKCTTDLAVRYDGLIHSVTHGKPQGLAIEECAPYADYFYLEALARFLKHNFIRPW